MQQRKADLDAEVERCSSKNLVRLGDLAAPVTDVLRGLPGVELVEAALSPAKRTKRLIHFLDWHSVDRATMLRPVSP